MKSSAISIFLISLFFTFHTSIFAQNGINQSFVLLKSSPDTLYGNIEKESTSLGFRIALKVGGETTNLNPAEIISVRVEDGTLYESHEVMVGEKLEFVLLECLLYLLALLIYSF